MTGKKPPLRTKKRPAAIQGDVEVPSSSFLIQNKKILLKKITIIYDYHIN